MRLIITKEYYHLQDRLRDMNFTVDVNNARTDIKIANLATLLRKLKMLGIQCAYLEDI